MSLLGQLYRLRLFLTRRFSKVPAVQHQGIVQANQMGRDQSIDIQFQAWQYAHPFAGNQVHLRKPGLRFCRIGRLQARVQSVGAADELNAIVEPN